MSEQFEITQIKFHHAISAQGVIKYMTEDTPPWHDHDLTYKFK